MEQSLRSGQKQLLFIMGALFLISLVLLLSALSHNSNQWSYLPQAIITMTLWLYTYRGAHWARIALAIALTFPGVLYGLSVLPTTLTLLGQSLTQGSILAQTGMFLALALIGMLHIASVILLVFSKNIRAFMNYQKL